MGTSTSPAEFSDRLIDKYRYVHVEDSEWANFTLDGFKERMANIGVHVENVFWSGFNCQGDGAMFEGNIEDWGKYLSHLGYTDPILSATATEYWTYSWKHSGRYYHENSAVFNEDLWVPENPYTYGYYKEEPPDGEKFRGAVWDAAMAQHDLLELNEKIQEDLRDHMRDLYRELEKEYDQLTSDEVIIEYLRELDPNELIEQE
jgi:hypothetical protein